ncbi:Hypothetical protein SCF082_LOCUS26999, partial [Durusdinium trenchii]
WSRSTPGVPWWLGTTSRELSCHARSSKLMVTWSWRCTHCGCTSAARIRRATSCCSRGRSRSVVQPWPARLKRQRDCCTALKNRI